MAPQSSVEAASHCPLNAVVASNTLPVIRVSERVTDLVPVALWIPDFEESDPKQELRQSDFGIPFGDGIYKLDALPQQPAKMLEQF